MTDDERGQIVIDITRQLDRLVHNTRQCLNWNERLFLGEQLRDAADHIDFGVMKRSTRKMVPRLKRLKRAGSDASG